MFECRQILTRMRLGDTDRAIARVGLMGRRKLAQLRRTAEAAGWLDVATPLPGDPVFAHVQGFERQFGCEPQQCGNDDDQAVKQQGLRWLFVRVGIHLTGDAKQGLRVLHGPVGISDSTVVLVARYVRTTSAVGRVGCQGAIGQDERANLPDPCESENPH